MVENSPLQKIEKALITDKNKGINIQSIMDITKLARGTVKAYLDELISIGRVHEEEYGQNTKVFFLNGKEKYQDSVQMKKDGILFVDVMTDPWKNPFVRIKLRKDSKDLGAIFLNNEKAIDELIKVLKGTKHQLEKYREIDKKIEN